MKSVVRVILVSVLVISISGGLCGKLFIDYIVNLQRQETSEPVSPVSGNPIKPGFLGDKMNNPSYRGYLQGLATGGDKTANALLQIVGDDGNAGAFTDPHFVNANGINKSDLINANNKYVSSFQAPQTSAPAAPGGGSSYSSGSSGRAVAPAQDTSGQLNSLLATVNNTLDQGVAKNNDQYNQQVNNANTSRAQTLAGYGDQRISQNQAKQSAYDTINQNANTGYNSLAQLIGRSAGTGSSAFQQLLPNVIGKDTSSKHQAATDTYGQNLAGIDKAQNQYDIGFQNTLQDLFNQKKQNEGDLNIGAQNQRLNLQNQFATSPQQAVSNIDNSRNAVQSFFDQFRPQYSASQAVAPTPDMAAYNTDRSAVNAQQQGGADPTNPYSQLLRKKLQGTI